MASKYAVLQSGFLSEEHSDIIMGERPNSQLINTALRLSKNYKELFSPYAYHRGVESLFIKFLSDPKNITKIEFRERVIITFKNAMQNKSFYEWLSIQKESKTVSDMHLNFVNDTVKYLITGKRSIDVDSWTAMVTAAIIDITDGFSFDVDYAKSLDVNLNKLIVQYTSIPGGFTDMLYFMKVVFGKTYQRRVN